MAMEFKPIGTLDGKVASCKPFKCAASQTIDVGQCVFLNTSGLVEEAAAADATLLGVAASSVSSSSAGDAIDVWCDPATVFLATADAEVTQSLVGDEVDLVVSGSGVHLVDVGASTTDVFIVVDDYQNKVPSAANTKCLVRINPSKHSLA